MSGYVSCVCMGLHGMKCILLQKLLSENVPISEHGSLSAPDCASICLVSSLWEYIMAKEHVCQWEDKLKQDVLAPRSFEGVPHHTSDSVEGRSTTIKGHSVYLNLLGVCLPDVAKFVFHLLTRTLFLFLQQVCYSTFCTDGREEKSTFSCWREERLNLNIV